MMPAFNAACSEGYVGLMYGLTNSWTNMVEVIEDSEALKAMYASCMIQLIYGVI